MRVRSLLSNTAYKYLVKVTFIDVVGLLLLATGTHLKDFVLMFTSPEFLMVLLMGSVLFLLVANFLALARLTIAIIDKLLE